MYEDETAAINPIDIQEPARHPPSSANDESVEENPTNISPTIPKPVFMRLLILFGGGIGCLLVGIIALLATGDLGLLVMSGILCIAFVTKGFLLKRKIISGQIYRLSGVCVNIVPKLFGRYRRIELVDTSSGDDVHFILPKKVIFKIGHVYNCYFDNQINNRPVSINNSTGGFFNTDMDLPTNGFLGFEDFGVYQEKPMVAVPVSGNNTENNKEEKNHDANKH